MRQKIGITGIGLGLGMIIGHYTGNLGLWIFVGTAIGGLIAIKIGS